MEVLVFKTSLKNKKHVEMAAKHLRQLPGITRWNVDLHDSDNILRIEAKGLSPRIVEHTMLFAGYHCEELPD